MQHDASHQAHSNHPDHHMGRHPGAHKGMVSDFQRRLLVSVLLTIPILLLSPMIQAFLGVRIRFPLDQVLLFILATTVYLYGGQPFITGFIEEIQNRRIGMMTLIAVAITSAYFYSTAIAFGLPGMGFYWELATLIDIMLLGHLIEMRSVMGASRALEALVELLPSVAHRLKHDETLEDVPLEAIHPGDRVLVKPGEKIPVDSEVVKGESSVNESMLTGESNPVAKGPGDPLIGGSINGEGALTVSVKHTGEASYLAQVVRLVKEAQTSKSQAQDLADRAAQWLTLIALGGGVLTFVLWMSFYANPAFSLERMVTVMVIACPHALGLAVPLVIAISTTLSATHGFLIRNRQAFEQARKIQAVVFDKTGTLTEGRFGITDVIALSDCDKTDILRYAASIERFSEHPIAKGIAVSTQETFPVENFKALPGKGAEGCIEGKMIQVVSPGFLAEHGQAVKAPVISEWPQQGKTVIYVLRDSEVIGAIALADLIRPEAKAAIQQLKALGIHCLMLTGDNPQVAARVAQDLGLDEYFAEVLPQDKAAKIKEIQARNWVVAMTGDGVNDAPALAQADVGIAIGAGTDVAIETADIILVRSNPLDVVAVLQLAQTTYRKMVQNLWWATGYNVVAIPLAAGILYRWGILLSPALGAVLMSASTVIVAINAQLLRMPSEATASSRREAPPGSPKTSSPR